MDYPLLRIIINGAYQTAFNLDYPQIKIIRESSRLARSALAVGFREKICTIRCQTQSEGVYSELCKDYK